MEKICKVHGLTDHGERKGGGYRCKKCQVDSVIKRRRLVKLKAIEYKGGQCQNCGYNKCPDVLEFHHLDPTIKGFRIGSGATKAWKTIKQELDKCVLLCANCHRETHYKAV